VSEAELERHRAAAGLGSAATIVYTSGTTGRPKGCVVSHGNLVLLADNLIPHLPDPLGAADPRTVMFLPLAHVLAHAVQVVCIAAGATVAYSSVAELLATLRSFRPTFLLGVPRVFEKVYAGALDQAARSGRSGMFAKAATVARDYSAAIDEQAAGLGEGPGRRLRLAHAVFDRLVYGRIRAIFGGALTTTVSGGGPLSPQLAHFFRGVGVPVLEGYGLTETTGPCTVNTTGAIRVGSVGRPVPGTSVRIADDGEVLVRGIGVSPGYDSEATDSALDADGYLATGDLGRLDADGFLTITGRKKDLIVTAGGKNVAPEPLEDRVRQNQLVEHAVVVGEGRPFVSALVVLDREGLATWCRDRGRSLDPITAASDPEVLAEIQSAVDAANALVSRAESIRKFTVIGLELSIASGHLTPSLKLRRAAVIEACRGEIERLYS
jgi:long-chain acyl-CoA synthetase